MSIPDETRLEDGTLVDRGEADNPNKTEADRLLRESDMSNAPDWAKVLYHQQRAILDLLGE